MDRRITPFSRGKPVTLQLEGDPVRAYTGESVAVALFASGVSVLSRSIKYHRPRTFFCLSGHCAACLMRIDGVPNVRSCRAPVAEGTTCERQNAFPSAGFDLLAAADWLFPHGMDHHTLLAGQPLLRPVLEKVVRELGGLGRLPDAPAAPLAPPVRRHVEVLVIGGGPAGLSCATAAAKRGRRVLLLDEGDRPGGSLFAEPGGPARALELTESALAAGVEILADTTAIAWFPEDEGGVLAAHTPTGLAKLTADRYVHATGTYDQNILCEDNDRPGVLAARAVGRLLLRYGVRPGNRVAIVGSWGYGDRLSAALETAGIPTLRAAEIERVHGRPWVQAIERKGATPEECDLVAAAAPPLPASELGRQHGAAIADSSGAFALGIDANGQTSVPGVFACGEVTGMPDPERALGSGLALGTTI